MKTHRIEGTDNLLMQTIKDQATSLEHGWREAIQNGLDSPSSTRVDLDFDYERTVVRDDGDGVDISSDDGLALLKNLGETSKDRDDDTTIGQFGVGKGQVIAKGRTAFVSQGTALVFDVEEWGLQCKEVPADEVGELHPSAGGEHDGSGITVVVDHYTDEVPDPERNYRWNTYERHIKRRFRYVSNTIGVDVHVNGEKVSDNDPFADFEDSRYAYTGVEDLGEAGEAAVAVEAKSHGGVEFYSNGVYVKKNSDLGVRGVVVTFKNMDLDFARDDIKEGCPVRRALEERLAEIRSDVFEGTPSHMLNEHARELLTEEFIADGRFSEKKFLKTANEGYMSPKDVMRKKKVGFSEPGNAAADRLAEAYGMTILDSTDPAVSKVKAMTEAHAEVFDPEEKAEELGLFEKGKELPEDELNTVQEKKLLAARVMADRLGIHRDIRYGESSVNAGWTDGSSYIFVTDDAAPSRNRAAWVWEMAETLCHEACHNEETMDGCDHGSSFDRCYRRRWFEAVKVVADFITEVERDGLADVVEGVRVVRPDMPSWDDLRNGGS